MVTVTGKTSLVRTFVGVYHKRYPLAKPSYQKFLRHSKLSNITIIFFLYFWTTVFGRHVHKGLLFAQPPSWWSGEPYFHWGLLVKELQSLVRSCQKQNRYWYGKSFPNKMFDTETWNQQQSWKFGWVDARNHIINGKATLVFVYWGDGSSSKHYFSEHIR